MKSFRVGQRNPGIPATSTAWWFFALPQPEKSWSERQLGSVKNSQLFLESHNPAMFQSPPTSLTSDAAS